MYLMTQFEVDMTREFVISFALLLFSIANIASSCMADDRPNILFAFADDWGWPHAGAYGDPVVETPSFDRLAREGALFNHAYVSSPSCTPSRGALFTGLHFWRLEGAANLWSVFPDKFETFPERLKKSGYYTGTRKKAWGPGKTQTPGRNLSGDPSPDSLREFLKIRPKGKPFCYWLGTSDPHRGYEKGSGLKSGMNLDEISLFPFFPDVREVRSDVADYYFEVQRFDQLVGQTLRALEEAGELENTIVVMSGDHGMPFPRCKSNNYDSGARVPLAIRWPKKIKAGTIKDDFVSLVDLAPTFYEAAGISIPDNLSGRSLLPLLAGNGNQDRSFILHGKERHVPGQEGDDFGGYPTRAIRTQDFLYLHNLRPDRWPAGTPNYKLAAIPGVWLADCDNGPTKSYMFRNRDKDDRHRILYDLSFGKRSQDELYDLQKDPYQMDNVASDPRYQAKLNELKRRLLGELKKQGDPRAFADGLDFESDKFKYLGKGPRFTGFATEAPRPKQKNGK